MVVTAVSTAVSDALFVLLLKDDRLIMQLDAIKAVIDEKMRWLGNIDIRVWDLLASICGDAVAGDDLCSAAIEAAHTSVAFFWFRTLRRLVSYPWTTGSVDDKLRSLAEES